MKRQFLPSILSLLALAACATPESRIRTNLIDLGFERQQAACMADQVADRLSGSQIKTLARLAGMTEKRMGDMTIRDLSRLLANDGNAELITIFARAGLGCAIMG